MSLGLLAIESKILRLKNEEQLTMSKGPQFGPLATDLLLWMVAVFQSNVMKFARVLARNQTFRLVSRKKKKCPQE